LEDDSRGDQSSVKECLNPFKVAGEIKKLIFFLGFFVPSTLQDDRQGDQDIAKKRVE